MSLQIRQVAVILVAAALGFLLAIALQGAAGTDEVASGPIKQEKLPLIQGKDGMWEVNKKGSLEKPTAVIVEYTTGQPSVTGEACGSVVYCRNKYIDRLQRPVIVELALGNLQYQGSGSHIQRIPLPVGAFAGEVQAIGLQNADDSRLLRMWIVIPPEVEYPG